MANAQPAPADDQLTDCGQVPSGPTYFVRDAVELIGAEYEIPGAWAYKILVQMSETAGVSVREMACIIVQAPKSN